MNKLRESFPKIIKEIRGRGFLIGLQLHRDQTNFIEKLMKNKLLTIRAAENVIRILPPLNVKKSEIDKAVKILNKVCKVFGMKHFINLKDIPAKDLRKIFNKCQE